MSRLKPKLVFIVVALIAFALRILVSLQGYNTDLESYWIVSKIVADGGNVYSETSRYNYAPIWSYILGISRDMLSVGNLLSYENFHILIAVFLSITDILIALMLFEIGGISSSFFYLINPVSILITGFHSQFDNLALLFGIFAIYLMQREIRGATFSIAVSLLVKHILIFLPVWLWLLEKKRVCVKKIYILAFPYAVFALSFVPFALMGVNSRDGILSNVLLYNSGEANCLMVLIWRLLLSYFDLQPIVVLRIARIAFFTVMLIIPVMIRSYTPIRSLRTIFLIYIYSIVIFTSGMTDQYLVIPLIACAISPRSLYSWLYTLTASLAILSSPHNIGQIWFPSFVTNSGVFHVLAQCFLVFALRHLCYVASLQSDVIKMRFS